MSQLTHASDPHPQGFIFYNLCNKRYINEYLITFNNFCNFSCTTSVGLSMSSEISVTDLVRTVGRRNTSVWLSNNYDRFNLSSRDGNIILKKNISNQGIPSLAAFISQYDDVSNAFVKQYAPVESQSLSQKRKPSNITTPPPQSPEKPKTPKKSPKRRRKDVRFNLPNLTEEDLKKYDTCIQIAGLENDRRNSCFIDSVLMIFFTVLQDFTKKYIIEKKEYNTKYCDFGDGERDKEVRNKIKEAFAELWNAIKKNDTPDKCTNFRALLKDCKDAQQLASFSIPQGGKGDTMGDPIEFLDAIFEMYEIEPLLYYEGESKRIRGTSDFEKDPDAGKVKRNIPLWTLSLIEYKNILEGQLFDLVDITTQDVVSYYTTSEIEGTSRFDMSKLDKSIFSSPMVAIAFTRNTAIITEEGEFKEVVDLTKIIPNEEIMLLDGSKLILIASIIYLLEKHYTSVFRCKDRWWYYDDLAKGSLIVPYATTYKEMIDKNNGIVTTNGVVHFYIKKEFAGEYNS